MPPGQETRSASPQKCQPRKTDKLTKSTAKERCSPRWGAPPMLSSENDFRKQQSKGNREPKLSRMSSSRKCSNNDLKELYHIRLAKYAGKEGWYHAWLRRQQMNTSSLLLRLSTPWARALAQSARLTRIKSATTAEG